MAESDDPEPDPADGSGLDADLLDDALDDDDDEPVGESGLGALWQLLMALVAVAALLVVVLGAAALLARLFR
jgi:hypothetical protein